MPTRKQTTASRSEGHWVLSRHINPTVQCFLWGRSAGRCEFTGCNKPLWRSSVTKEPLNLAQKAHIYSFSPDGPRGNRGIPKKKLNQASNLMLACPECHLKIDQCLEDGRYTVSTLQNMKRMHEQRVETATSFGPSTESHILVYSSNIGAQFAPYLIDDLTEAMFRCGRYPASEEFRDLSTPQSVVRDKTAEFWASEASSLKQKYAMTISERLSLREISHISVFSIAPQPLLILLGTLLGDITPCDVYQRHREPKQSWVWPDNAASTTLKRVDPSHFQRGAVPAVVVATSATVNHERIYKALGKSTNIWMITIDLPNNDSTKTRDQLSQFRKEMRLLFDQIKAKYDQKIPLHIFPVTSVSMAIELGRVHMPKADMPLAIYDEIPGQGFVRAIDIPNGGVTR